MTMAPTIRNAENATRQSGTSFTAHTPETSTNPYGKATTIFRNLKDDPKLKAQIKDDFKLLTATPNKANAEKLTNDLLAAADEESGHSLSEADKASVLEAAKAVLGKLHVAPEDLPTALPTTPPPTTPLPTTP